MKRKDYPQLSARAHRLLKSAVEEAGVVAVAKKLKYSHPAISLALAKKYPGNASRLGAQIVGSYCDFVDCPHLGEDLPPSECAAYRDRKIPSAPRSEIDHWRACQCCPNNPKNQIFASIKGAKHVRA